MIEIIGGDPEEDRIKREKRQLRHKMKDKLITIAIGLFWVMLAAIVVGSLTYCAG